MATLSLLHCTERCHSCSAEHLGFPAYKRELFDVDPL